MHLKIDKLSKQWPGGVRALQDITLELKPGMFGLLGPNGAGKSTLMKIIATLELPDSGRVTFDGRNILRERAYLRNRLGYLPQFFGVYPQLTGAEFLRYIARLNGVPRSELQDRVMLMLEKVSLLSARDRKVKTYSGGMLRRLGIAQALVHDPALLIVDEPTVGLDPEERIRFRNLLTEISRDKIIILSTHIVGDISSTCEDIAILSHGRLVFRGSPGELTRKAAEKVWLLECDERDFAEVAEHLQIISTIPAGGRLQMRVVGEYQARFSMQQTTANLEDAYIYFMEEHMHQHQSAQTASG
ncbi:MAG TPA: ABC transporter ATP-binding protein [Bacteroidetes bacterium]|nr:ABC transporter ATP-binding protein [Bacteroidota bacterium]